MKVTYLIRTIDMRSMRTIKTIDEPVSSSVITVKHLVRIISSWKHRKKIIKNFLSTNRASKTTVCRTAHAGRASSFDKVLDVPGLTKLIR